MTTDSNPNPAATGSNPPNAKGDAGAANLTHMPGLAATAVYMLLLAAVVTLYVVQGRLGTVFLAFPVLLAAAGLGLLFLLRWAWALALAAIAALAGLFFWNSVARHMPYFLVHGLLNLVIFLYLLQARVRARLR